MSDKGSGKGSAFAMGLIAGSAAAMLITRLSSSRSKDSIGGASPNNRPGGNTNNSTTTQQPQFESQSTQSLPPEIRSEMLSRNALYFASSDGMPRIESSCVLVVGLGGVGSHTAHMLARSGVGYLRMVDFDQVTLSSLNRHAVATLKDVGLPKVTVLAKHLREICPDEGKLALDPIVKMYTGDREKDGSMMDPPSGYKKWDIVIDAIDDVPTKTSLIAHCAKRGIRVISCMGAAGKSDPTRVHISDLRSASRDPLATSVRQKLRYLWKKEQKASENTNESGDESNDWLSCIDDDSKVAVIYSSEKVVAKLAELTEEQKEEGMHNFGAMDNMRVRVLPVVGTMPAIMGQSLAAMSLCELGGKPFQPVGAERIGRNVRHKLYQHLQNRERKLQDKLEPTLKEPNVNAAGDEENRGRFTPDGIYIGPVEIDADDVEYIMAELWRNKCALTGERLGTSMALIRWDRKRPAAPNNLVLMCTKAAKKFENDWDKLGDGRDGVEKEIRQKVESRLATCVLDAEDAY